MDSNICSDDVVVTLKSLGYDVEVVPNTLDGKRIYVYECKDGALTPKGSIPYLDTRDYTTDEIQQIEDVLDRRIDTWCTSGAVDEYYQNMLDYTYN